MYQYFLRLFLSFFFFFNDTATTEIYTLSLHDALPILAERAEEIDLDRARAARERAEKRLANPNASGTDWRSEEHTSELQSQSNLVCRLLLEKKKKIFHALQARITIAHTAQHRGLSSQI